jgi:mono/diheme cytochrome c family protein
VNRWNGIVLACLVASGCAERAAPPSGALMYQRYCVSCHGIAGKGDGPIASSLQRPPADLTTIAKRAGGRFDEAAVLAIIDGRRRVAEHGPREMPVWGAVFDEELKDQPYTRYTGLLQSRLLVDYLRSLQEK